MKQIITAGPVPGVFSLPWHHGSRPFPIGNERASYWYSARTAIVQACHALGLRTGDRLLVPAFACGSEIDALLVAGLRPVYYRITSDLSVDFDHLEQLARDDQNGLRALFVTHYFGFGQDMDEVMEFAQRHGLLVIEDNAHGLYSRDMTGAPLGSRGDASVFSFTKTLPVPDGGALVLRAQPVLSPGRGRAPHVLPVAGKMRYLLQQSVERTSPGAARWLRQALLDPMARGVKSRAHIPSVEKKEAMDLIGFKRERSDWRMSIPARWMARTSMSKSIPVIRRRNYAALLDQIESGDQLLVLLPSLPQGSCPLLFPVMVDDPQDLLRYLASTKIRAKHFWSFTHPDVPMEHFPLERRFKQNTVALPVHQDLDVTDMARMAQAVNAWQRRARVVAS